MLGRVTLVTNPGHALTWDGVAAGDSPATDDSSKCMIPLKLNWDEASSGVARKLAPSAARISILSPSLLVGKVKRCGFAV